MERLEKQIGKRVRALRGGATQKAFAESLGLSQYVLSRVEQGVWLPKVSTLLSISQASGVSLDWLCTGEKAPQRR